jgi:hypothetical protein
MNLPKLDYPEGSILFDVRYHRKPECFEVVYHNPITKQLEVQYEEPIVDIWFLKEEYRTNKYQISQVEMDKCYPVYCKVSQIPQAIAINIGGEYKEYFDENSKTMSRKELTDYMNKCPWVFKADFVPDVYFRLRWLQKYGDQIDVSNVTYGFLDIEVDVIDKTVDPKDITDVTQPVNAISVILPHKKICAVLILGPRPKHNNYLHPKFYDLLDKQKVEFDWLVNHQEEFKRMIVEEDEDNKKYLEGYDIRLHIFDYQDEIKLIKTAYDYINKYRPMFMLSWNAKFDDNYLQNRISYLGYDPKDFIIPKEFKTDMLYYHEDDSKMFSLKNSKDWYYTSTYTVYMCQMRLFAMIRKSQAERRSYGLSAVGKDMAKIDKLTQTKSGAFRQFAYTDFLKFILYNVRDVVVQLAIELACNDCQSLVARSYMFATQYSKCFQETHIVRNIREFIFEEEGFVQSNRLIVDPNVDTAFKGAFVAPTVHNSPTGLILNGKRINNIMFGVLDADAASYYPSTKMGMNMDPMSLLYKCKIDNKVFVDRCVNHSFNQEYTWYDSKNKPHAEDMTGPIINSYKNGNEMSLLYNWLNAPSVSEIFEYLDAKLSTT